MIKLVIQPNSLLFELQPWHQLMLELNTFWTCVLSIGTKVNLSSLSVHVEKSSLPPGIQTLCFVSKSH